MTKSKPRRKLEKTSPTDSGLSWGAWCLLMLPWVLLLGDAPLRKNRTKDNAAGAILLGLLAWAAVILFALWVFPNISHST